MHTLVVISDGAFPDPEARAVLLAGGIVAREMAQDEVAKLTDAPDLLLVARTVPAAEALEIARRVRSHEPLEEVATLLAIDRREAAAVPPGAGADDFLFRPIDAQELLARARFLLWRTRRIAAEGVVQAGDGLSIDTRRYEVSVDGRRVDLTLKEYELLLFLAQHPGQVFTRDVLLDRIWGQSYFGGTRTVDVHVRRVRMKIERGGRVYIDTVRGVGYKFNG
jgi:two-component system, OmpR family, alkaline phosphatase synthesis response regulator PhoP